MEQSWTFVRGVANTALDGLEAGGLPSTLLRWERRVPAHTAGREWGVGSYWLLGLQETPARWVQGLVTQLPQILLDAPCPEVDLTSDSRQILLAPQEAPALRSSALCAPLVPAPRSPALPAPSLTLPVSQGRAASPAACGVDCSSRGPRHSSPPRHAAPTWLLCLATSLEHSMALALGLVPGVLRHSAQACGERKCVGEGDSGGSQGRCPGDFGI